jgi:hypothetical protein
MGRRRNEYKYQYPMYKNRKMKLVKLLIYASWANDYNKEHKEGDLYGPSEEEDLDSAVSNNGIGSEHHLGLWKLKEHLFLSNC